MLLSQGRLALSLYQGPPRDSDLLVFVARHACIIFIQKSRWPWHAGQALQVDGASSPISPLSTSTAMMAMANRALAALREEKCSETITLLIETSAHMRSLHFVAPGCQASFAMQPRRKLTHLKYVAVVLESTCMAVPRARKQAPLDQSKRALLR